MERPKAHSIVFTIAKYAFADEVRQKSLIVLFVLSTLSVLLLRQCYRGDYMVNGQALSADAIALTLSKVAFHVIAAGVMFIAALLTMRVYKRDRDEECCRAFCQSPLIAGSTSRAKYLDYGHCRYSSCLSFIALYSSSHP